jgi:hypothetical protein
MAKLPALPTPFVLVAHQEKSDELFPGPVFGNMLGLTETTSPTVLDTPSVPRATPAYKSPLLSINLGDFTNTVPRVLTECCAFVREHGLGVAGIFRLAPAKHSLLEAKRRYDLGVQVNLAELGGVHLACGLLKLWFRELPTTIVPTALYPVIRENLTGLHFGMDD